MAGRPNGIQMTPTGVGPKYLRTLLGQASDRCSAYFCALKEWFRSCVGALKRFRTRMRSETAEAVTRSQRPSGGYRLPSFSMGASTDGGASVMAGTSVHPS